MNKEVVIVSAARTPIGRFLGSLSGIPATELGGIAIRGALEKIQLDPELVEEVLMGNVLQANLGQAPAKQAALFAGISENVPCTTVNKVCASGMKTVLQAAQAIQCGAAEIVVAGGMENMSAAPHYLVNRKEKKLGNITAIDGLLKDGLTNPYDLKHMGACADLCAEKYEITRAAQDAFAIRSHQRFQNANDQGKFDDERIPVNISKDAENPVWITQDETHKDTNLEKIESLPPAFSKKGSVTAANASPISDGAAALVLMSSDKAKALGIAPLAKITAYAEAAQDPTWFTSSPAKALPKALKKTKLTLSEIDFFEINEAFSVVGIANCELLGIDPEKTNVNGGAVAMGHPLGCSGARILVTLLAVLKQNNAKIGAAAICNGGGGASALIIENTRI
tara:strand:- start:14113 stop:15297 length:1185 start_codon:yes stop_codon:yes gene_type:complete